MYDDKKKKSRLKLTDLVASLETEMTFEEVQHKLEISRRGVDRMLEIEFMLVNLQSCSSLSRQDIKTKSWDSFKTDDPVVEKYARIVRSWDFSDRKGLFLHGKPGCAKTHMLKATILEHCSSSRMWKFLTVADFMSTIKKFEKTSPMDYINDLVNRYAAIVLDDLGTEKASDFEQQELFRLFEAISRNGKHIFMSSNLSMRELEKKYDSRISSRIKEYMNIIEITSSDYRETINREHLKIYREKVKIMPIHKN